MDVVCFKDNLRVLAKVFVNIDWFHWIWIPFCGGFWEELDLREGTLSNCAAPAEQQYKYTIYYNYRNKLYNI
jgi:hypothetical protein